MARQRTWTIFPRSLTAKEMKLGRISLFSFVFNERFRCISMLKGKSMIENTKGKNM